MALSVVALGGRSRLGKDLLYPFDQVGADAGRTGGPDAEETNAIDGGYDPLLEIRYSGHKGGARLARFDFVLASA